MRRTARSSLRADYLSARVAASVHAEAVDWRRSNHAVTQKRDDIPVAKPRSRCYTSASARFGALRRDRTIGVHANRCDGLYFRSQMLPAFTPACSFGWKSVLSDEFIT